MPIKKITILEHAVNIARRDGWASITRENIAFEAECATGTINYHFSTMTQLKRSVLRHIIKAVDDGEHDEKFVQIIGQHLAMGDTTAKKASDNVKRIVLGAML